MDFTHREELFLPPVNRELLEMLMDTVCVAGFA